MDIRSLLAFLKRRGWVLVVGALVAGLTTYAVTRSMQPVYQATASVLVVNQLPATGLAGADPVVVNQLSDILISDRLMKTYVELVARPVILQVVSDRLDGIYSAQALAGKVSVTNAPADTQILKISVKDASPTLAASIANITAQAFIEENAREIGRPGTVSISQTAEAPNSPVEPKVRLYTIAAAFLGLVVASVYTRFLEYLDDTIKTSDDVTSVLDLPTLGVIDRADASGFRRIWNRAQGQGDFSLFLEDVRELRTRVRFLKMDSDVQTIAVVSQNPEEGRTTTAASLAEALAEAGDRVILVDANLRNPRLHEIYGVSNTFGLTGFLMQQDMEKVAPVLTRVENLSLVPSGPRSLSSSDFITSKRMVQAINSLREEAEYVIFDTSPLASASDALILASRVDGTLMVVQAGRTRQHDVLQTLRRFREVKANILGVVLNKAKSGRRYNYETPATSARGSIKPMSTNRTRVVQRASSEEIAIPPSENA